MNLGKIWRLNDSIQESETRIIGPTTFPLQKRANWNQECQKKMIFQVRKLFGPGASHVNVNHASFWCTFSFSRRSILIIHILSMGNIFGWKFTKLLRLDPWPTRVAPQSLAAAKKNRLSYIQQGC